MQQENMNILSVWNILFTHLIKSETAQSAHGTSEFFADRSGLRKDRLHSERRFKKLGQYAKKGIGWYSHIGMSTYF